MSRTKKITSLTPEQTALMPVWRDVWTKIGLATKTRNADPRPAIDLLYRCAGLEPPTHIVYAYSPMGGMMLANLLEDGNAWRGVGDSVRVRVTDDIWRSVGPGVWQDVGRNVWWGIEQAVYQTVERRVRDKVWQDVRESVEDGIKIIQWKQPCSGQHDAGWLAWASYFDHVGGLQAAREARGLSAMAEYGWYWPYQDAIIVSPRPEYIDRDAQGRLHSATRMAVQYPDGWGVYAWHGVVIPAHIIEEPDKLTPEMALAEPNTEIRRCMIEVMGPTRFFACAEVVHEDVDGRGMPRRLLRMPVEGTTRGYLQAIHFVCPSQGKDYVSFTSQTATTCQEATASNWRLRPELYAPMVES